jgi:hypothetical protein
MPVLMIAILALLAFGLIGLLLLVAVILEQRRFLQQQRDLPETVPADRSSDLQPSATGFRP